jgi:hypothetical protein
MRVTASLHLLRYSTQASGVSEDEDHLRATAYLCLTVPGRDTVGLRIDFKAPVGDPEGPVEIDGPFVDDSGKTPIGQALMERRQGNWFEIDDLITVPTVRRRFGASLSTETQARLRGLVARHNPLAHRGTAFQQGTGSDNCSVFNPMFAVALDLDGEVPAAGW